LARRVLFKLTKEKVSETGGILGFSQKPVALLEEISHPSNGTRALRGACLKPTDHGGSIQGEEAGVRNTGSRPHGADRARVLLSEFVR
jgi:hypothetical protein